jgi:general nucleoside transport system permease protein
MSVSTAQRETPPSAAKAPPWLQKLGRSLARPLFAVVLALLVGCVIIFITSAGAPGDRLNAVIQAYQNLFIGSYGSLQNTSYSLVVVTSLIFAGLSVAIAARGGLFNIGAAGQMTVGAVVAGVIGLDFSSLPSWVLIPLMITASAVSAAIWGGIVGALKAWRGAHEVVTTIMLNWIAFNFADYLLVNGPLQAPRLSAQSLPLSPQATLPSIAQLYNQTLGTFLPAIASPTDYSVDASFFFAIIALAIYWFIVRRTTFGYEQRIVGQNVRAARYAGIRVNRNMILTMALAGAFAGLAGSLRLMGQQPYQLIGTSFSNDTTGFDAIGVALLARTTPVGIFISALLFGGLNQASGSMELYAKVPADLVSIIQALVLFSIAAEFLPVIQRSLPGLMGRSRKPALVPNIVGDTTVDEPTLEELTAEEIKTTDAVPIDENISSKQSNLITSSTENALTDSSTASKRQED